MFGIEKNRERERFYLLPGMGGRNARQKHKLLLQWAITIGLLASAIFAAMLYLLNRPLR